VHPYKDKRRWFSCLGVLLALAGWAGCRPAFESSDQAVSLPLVEHDPAENSLETGRWPGWRGKNGCGVAPGAGPAIELSNMQGFRWKKAVPGMGDIPWPKSSPVVWDNFVLLTTALDDTDPPTLAVLCYDRADGTLLWQAEAGEARGRTHDKNGYASASVATDGQRIFAFFGGTGLFCYDFAGKRLWRADLGELHHRWGTAASPVLYGNTVIQLCDCEDDSYIAAFDKATGERVWRTDRPSRGCWSTPVFVEAEADGVRRTEMVVNGTDAPSGDGLIIAYDPGNGRELWRVRGTTQFVTPTPLVCEGLVYCMSGRNGPIAAIKPGGSGDVTDTHVVWKHTKGGPYIPSGVAYRNRLFVLGDGGSLACYNAGSGRRIWGATLKGPFTASLAAAGGRIYAVNEHGSMSVFAAADSFQLLARNELHASCYATPAIADGDLLIRTTRDLYCFPAESTPLPANEVKTSPAKDSWLLFRGDAQATGVAHVSLPEKLARLWKFSDERGGFESTAAIADGTVYIGSTGGKFYALDLDSGRKRWEFSTQLGFTASPALRNGLVYIGDSDGQFFCLDAKTGKAKWKFDTQAVIDSSANFHKDNVLFGSEDSYLYCLKADTGELVWKYESPDQIRCCPTVVGDRAFVAGCDGRLHVIDLAAGKSVAEVDLGGPTMATPAVLGDVVYVGTEEFAFLAVDWKQAKVLWRYTNAERSEPFRSSAAVTPGAVIVGSRDKQVHALDPQTGRSLWAFTTKSRVDSSPVVVGGRVFVGSADGRVYALDVKTGREVWRFDAGGAVVGSPAVVAGRLVIGTDNGDLYCLGAKE